MWLAGGLANGPAGEPTNGHARNAFSCLLRSRLLMRPAASPSRFASVSAIAAGADASNTWDGHPGAGPAAFAAAEGFTNGPGWLVEASFALMDATSAPTEIARRSAKKQDVLCVGRLLRLHWRATCALHALMVTTAQTKLHSCTTICAELGNGILLISRKNSLK